MQIHLKNVIPHPLKDNFQGETDIWKKELNFQKGKNYLVTAPSGKGKSTFLHMMYGLRKDFDGRIFLNEKDTHTLKLEDWATIRQTQLSIVFQNLRLFPQLTGLENITINNDLQKSKTLDEIHEMAKRLGVQSCLEQQTRLLSYGQRQRVAIIRALCQPFSYLLLDEPFSHLDEENVKLACELIQEEVLERQASLILVSLGERYFFEYQEKLIL